MATAAPQVSGLQGMFECPVCLEKLKDPRILVCGHHFCCVCIEGIAGRYTELKCPTCRCETKLGIGKRVADLPRPVLVNELQTHISKLLEAVNKKPTKPCDLCNKKVTSVSHCHQCTRSFCAGCEANHKKVKRFVGHQTDPISNCVFCDSHPGEVITDYCEQCKKCLCLKCVMGKHSDHDTQDIRVLAKGSRSRLGEFVRLGGLAVDQAEVKAALKHVSEAERLRQQLRDSVSNLTGLLKEFQQKLLNLERDIETRLSAEIKNMKLYASDLNDLVISKASLLDYAKNLLEKSPEAELVMKEREFPTSPDGASVVTPYTTSLPEFELTFNTLSAGMKGLIDSCTITYKSHILGKGSLVTTRYVSPIPRASLLSLGKSPAKAIAAEAAPFTILHNTHSVRVAANIDGLVINTQAQRFIVRTIEEPASIKVYDFNGQLREKLGAHITGLVDNCSRFISLDTKRSLYLCPTEGALVLIDRAGYVTAKVKCNEPHGISYSEEEDVYVVSDCSTHKLYVIDATSHQIITEFGGPGSGDGQFKPPVYVHVGRVAGIAQPVIVTSERRRHRIQFHDMTGRHIKTIGSRGSGNGEIYDPYGVTTDPAGWVIICDSGNRRVVSYWSENNQDKWHVLLDSQQLERNSPQHVSCDPQTRVLAVATADDYIRLFQSN